MPAFAAERVSCDAKIVRIVRNLRVEPMTTEQQERAQQALYAAVEQCRPQGRGALHPAPAGQPADAPSQRGAVQTERQSLRAQQNILTLPEQREGERRLDAIERKNQSDPGAARDMMKVWQADRSLSTINRPIPGGPVSPSLVGPGDRH